jgi:putative PIN family toxin of toxin-antitoxin system
MNTEARRGGTAPRMVFDTNVVLSALVFAKGPSAGLRSVWQGGLSVPLVSTATARELVRVLGYPKFRLDPDQQRELLGDYLPYAQVVRIPEPPPKVPDCRDPLDVPFLHLAAAGRAAFLVTGDADLLTLGRVGHCQIVTPAAFAAASCVLSQSSAPLAETQQLVRRARTHSQLSEAQALGMAQEQVRAVRRRK